MDTPQQIRMMVNSDVLPSNFANEIVENNDTVVIRSNIKNMDDINEWVKDFGIRTNTKWNCRRTCPTGERFICRKTFVCHHSSYKKVPSQQNKKGISKNAECLASIKLKIKLNSKGTRYTDEFVKRGLVGQIIISPFHKHSLITAETLRFLPAEDRREQFEDYFRDGMGPAESAKYHKGVLEMKADFKPSDLANSRINPTQATIAYWHNKWTVQNLGARNGLGMIEKLKEKITAYSTCNIQVAFVEDPFAVAVVTPIMRRAHSLPTAKEIIFVDSTSSCDAENHAVTFMLTPCAAGAVPLGIFITKGQTETAYKQGFQLILDIVKESGFGNTGGPATFLTDDSDAEISALKKIWPLSQHFLCIFHVGQAVWRWLWDSKNGIPLNNRRHLMSFFQQIMYAETPARAEEFFMNAIGYVGSYIPTYNLWNDYLLKYWKRKEMWCLAFRNENIRGHNTNNFSEVAIRIFKDEVLSRVKAYNVISLIDFCATTLESYYKRRLQEFANARNAGPRLFLEKMRKKALESENPIKQEHIQMDEKYQYLFSVFCGNEVFSVDSLSACCSCSAGRLGKFCKHQFAIYYYYNICAKNFPPVEAKDKHQIAKLALGLEAPAIDFYKPFLLDSCKVRTIDENEKYNDGIPPFPESLDSTATQSYENDFGIDIEEEEIRKRFKILIDDGLKKFGPSKQVMRKAVARLEKVTSKGQWDTMWATFGSNVPLKRKAGAAIKVQPTSIARRAVGVTKGSKRLACGRPPIGNQGSTKKRKHNLSENIKLNQPNGKKH